MTGLPIDPLIAGWIINLLMGGFAFVFYRSYSQDQIALKDSHAHLKENVDAMSKEIKENKTHCEDKLENEVDRLESRVNDKFKLIIERVEGKLDQISKDTRKIPELEARLATNQNDVAWLKEQRSS